MPKDDEDSEVPLELSPEEADALEPKKRPEPHRDPNKHLSKIDPILMEKLSKLEEQEKSYQPKYSNGLPVFSRHQEEGSPLFGVLAFLFVVIAGFGGIRMLMGEPLVPVAVQELVYGKSEPLVLPPARYSIETNLVGYEVAVNGVKQNLFNNQFEYPAGSAPVTLTVSRVGYSTFTTQIIPSSGSHAVIKPVLAQAKVTGFLTYETVPGAKLTLFKDGAVVAELNTPVMGAKLPVGTYRAVLENSFIGYRKEQMITIEEWKTTSFHLVLDNSGAAEPPANR